MTDAAIIVLAGTESHADLGRVTNALQAAKEFADAGDEVRVIFDGAGTQWVGELESEDHIQHALYQSLSEVVEVCAYCANAFDVSDEVEASDAEAVSEFEGHPSIRQLATEGYEIITF